ncbi:MAG: ferritin-like domain-containing protein [Pseudonocardiaceae bacterium]
MSVFDLPRLHFAGIGITRLPTGPRSGLLDLGTNTAVADSAPFPVTRPAQEYHDYLDRRSVRFEPDGTVTPEGRFGSVKGWNFGGNGHFWVDAVVVAAERSPGEIDTTDHVVGRQLDLWGHYNDHLATTANRARVFDVDPASNWTTAVMVGQLSLGRSGRSHDVGYMATGDVYGISPPRWRNPRHILHTDEHPLGREFIRSVVHQFVVDKTDRLDWLDEAARSPVVSELRELLDSGEFGGLLVQFALFNMATPVGNDAPDRWDLHGTIAPWRRHDMRTYPAGRLLTGRELLREGRGTPLHTLTVEVSEARVTANMITAVPVVSRAATSDAGPTHQLGPRLDVGDLELRTNTGRLLGVFPRAVYLGPGFRLSGGVLSTPRVDGRRDDPAEPLRLQAPDGTVLLTEEEITIQSDQASLFLEHPNLATGQDFAVDVTVRSFVRGCPAKVDRIEVHQFFNPRGLPLDPWASAPDARSTDVAIAEFAAATRPGEPEEYRRSCTLSTDDAGQGRLAIRGARAGATQVLLLPPCSPLPGDPRAAGSAALVYDNDDRLGYWSSAGFLSVRVLPDTWYLDDIPSEEITFDLVYHEVFAYYELMYSFMKDEIMSLADISRVTTHARLIWLMCDPRNKDKTYYMPSTRDMTEPQTNLLLRFMQVTEETRQTPPSLATEKPAPGIIKTRDELCRALRQAATIELTVMLQYLFALWSIPTYSAGGTYVERGEWTPEQLRLMCGDGPHALGGGMRGDLLSVAREEMIHFLVINNIIMATGQPFHLPNIDFSTVNSQLPVPLDFCLEAFGRGSLQRFIALEHPYNLVRDIAGDGSFAATESASPYPYGSLSELYSAIREAIQRIPDVIMVEPGRGGGEHHLFMRESLNVTHPDYQLEVDDVSSAVFAIDFVTEHGEGNVIESVLPREESHFDTFLRISELLSSEYTTGPGGRRVPWNPAYPVTRNPTLRAGNPASDLVTNQEARAAMELFNRSYAIIMQLMVQHFNHTPDKSLRRSRLMNASIDLMTGVLRPLGEHIVTLPSGRPGRTAGPSFEMDREVPFIARPDVAKKWLVAKLEELSADAAKVTGLTETVPRLLRFLAEELRGMDPREL